MLYPIMSNEEYRMAFSFHFFSSSSNIQQDQCIYRNEIIQNLRSLNISQSSINKILRIVENMPCVDQMQRMLAFLTQLKDEKIQCEPYYLYSNYVAEFFCALSSLGFFASAFIYKDYLTLALAFFAILSHAVPLQILNNCDKIAAIAKTVHIATYYSLLLKNPDFIALGMLTAALGIAEFSVGRKYKEFFNGSLHSAWHLATAFGIYKFNDMLIKNLPMENADSSTLNYAK